MSTEKTMIGVSDTEQATRALRLAHAPETMLHQDNTDANPEQLDATDPRWIFAALVLQSISWGLLHEDAQDRLLNRASILGLGSLQGEAIIGIIERSYQRGGLDRQARIELARVPEASGAYGSALASRVRWMVFGVLFCWALLIAGLMQLIAFT